MNPLAATARRLWYDGYPPREIARLLDVRYSSVDPVLQRIVLYRRFFSVRKIRAALVAEHGITISVQFWQEGAIVRSQPDATTSELRSLADAALPRSLVRIDVGVFVNGQSFLSESGATPNQLHNIADYVDGLKRQAKIIL